MDFNSNLLGFLGQIAPMLQNFGGFQNQNNFDMQNNIMQNQNMQNQNNFSSTQTQTLAYYPNETIGAPNKSQSTNNSTQTNPQNNYQATSQETTNIAQQPHNYQNNNMLFGLLKNFLGSSFENGDMLSNLTSLIGKLNLNNGENNANILSNLFQNAGLKEKKELDKTQNKTKKIKEFLKVEDVKLDN